jgi:cyanophycin synthetase
MDYMFPKEQPSSIPIISVTGTNGKTTTTRMISHIFSLKGVNVEMTTTCGIYINKTCILKGDNTGPDSARAVLMDKNVDVAVLETARGGILRRGLGYDLADVGVITNITEDHLGLEGVDTIEDLVYVKSLVIEAIKSYGYAVLNADDPSVTLLSQRLISNVIYFSKNADNIMLKKHLMDGGIGVFIRDGFIYLGEEDRVEPIVKISEIPSTHGGMIGHNVENAMAATSACIGMKVDIETIAKGLKTFYGDDQQNPGRFNIYNVNNFKVIVDYGHNPAGYEAVIGALKNMNASNHIGIIGVPGDRRNKDITYVGNLCGRSFDYIYIKEDKDRRGRDPGEVAKLLEEGVISSKSGAEYKVILDEGDALKQAMQNAGDGDIITVFYEDYDMILGVINSFKESSKSSVKAIGAV